MKLLEDSSFVAEIEALSLDDMRNKEVTNGIFMKYGVRVKDFASYSSYVEGVYTKKLQDSLTSEMVFVDDGEYIYDVNTDFTKMGDSELVEKYLNQIYCDDCIDTGTILNRMSEEIQRRQFLYGPMFNPEIRKRIFVVPDYIKNMTNKELEERLSMARFGNIHIPLKLMSIMSQELVERVQKRISEMDKLLSGASFNSEVVKTAKPATSFSISENKKKLVVEFDGYPKPQHERVLKKCGFKKSYGNTWISGKTYLLSSVKEKLQKSYKVS